MKPAAYILTILMLLLVAQPLLVNCQLRVKPVVQKSCCVKNKSCHKKAAGKTTESKGCESTTGCNPSAGCAQCQYTAVSKFFYSDGIEEIRSVQIPSLNEKIQSGFSTDCWQPPEFVFA